MKYLLDTSIIIEFLHENRKVSQFLSDHRDDEIVTSVVCEAEICVGIFLDTHKILSENEKEKGEFFRTFDNIYSFNSEQAKIFGQIKADLIKKGQKIGDLDVMIAAAAIFYRAILVTKNPKHFVRIENLEVLPL